VRRARRRAPSRRADADADADDEGPTRPLPTVAVSAPAIRDVDERVVARRKERRARGLPAWARTRTAKARTRSTASAPRPVAPSGTGFGATGNRSFCHAVATVAPRGTSSISASAIPSVARRRRGQPSATTISVLIVAFSRKSTLSAKSETEAIARATAHSMRT